MKNLKRVFTMALALIMMLGMVTVPATASSFSDADEIVNEEAVSITAGLGLFAGSDGKFMPKDTVTRAQMATIIVKMLRGSQFNADAFKGYDTFSDTADYQGGWAEGYINACVQLGVVAGYGDGTFKPEKAVTTAEALTMIINALKVDAGKGEWPSTVMAKAEEMKLYGEMSSKPGTYAALTRDQLAVLTYKGLCYSPSGASGYKVPNVDIVFADIADAMKANGGVAGITEVVGEDALAHTVYEMKIAEGTIVGNQDTGLEYTKLSDGSAFNVVTGLDEIGHYVSVYYKEAYKNGNEPGEVYAIVDEATYVTVTDQVDDAKEYRAFFAKNYEKADNGWYFDGSYAGTYLRGNFAVTGYVPGQAAPEGTYVIYDGQVRGYIAPTVVTASRVTLVNTTVDSPYVMLSGVQDQLSIAEGDDEVTAYDGIAIGDLVTFVRAQGGYVLTRLESVTGAIAKYSTNEDGEIVITVDGKEYTDFGSANNNFVGDSNMKTLIEDIANVDYEQTYTFYLAPDGSVVCYEEAGGVSFNTGDTVYLVGSISTVTADGYGAYNKDNYGRGIDMNGDEVMLRLGTVRGTDKRGNGGSETWGSMTEVAAGFYSVKPSNIKEEKEYNIQKLTAFNSNARTDESYAMSYTSGIGWNFTGKLTISGRTYGKSADTRFLVLDDATLTNTAEFSASMSKGSCSVWLEQGQRMDCIVSDQTNGTHVMEVCVIHTQKETAANEMVYVSQYNNTVAGHTQAGYVYKVYNAKNGDEREITLNTGAALTPGFYSVSTGADGLNAINYLSGYTGSSADTNDNADNFYYYNFFYDNALTAYDGSTIWTDGVVNNETCTDAVPVVDDRDAQQITTDGVPKINSLKDIIALWTAQPDVTVSLDICYYSGGRRVSAIFVRNIGTALVDSNDVDSIIFVSSDPRGGAVTGTVVVGNGDPKATYAVGDKVDLDPTKVVILDCSGACWESNSCNGFFSIVGATPEGIKLKHQRATNSKGTIADHNVITGWDGNDQVATFDGHRALTACGYYCYTTTLDQTAASYYLDLSGDPAVTVIDMTGSGIDSLAALKSAAQTAVAAPGNSNGILISYYMANGGMTPDVIIVNATNASMQTDRGENIWMASPGETVYMPGGRTNATSVTDDEGEKNGAFARWANVAWSLDGQENGYLYTMSAFIPDFGVAGFYTVDQMDNNSIITLTYVDVEERTVTDGLPQADTYFQSGAVLNAEALNELARATSITYIAHTYTDDSGAEKTAAIIKSVVMPDPEARLYVDGAADPVASGDFAEVIAQAVTTGGTVKLSQDVTIDSKITLTANKPVTITDDGTKRTITVTSTNRAFDLPENCELTITGTAGGGLDIKGGASGEVAIMNRGKLTVQGSVVFSGFEYTNSGSSNTGGSVIYNTGTGVAVLDGVTFKNNTVNKRGGAVYSTGDLTVRNAVFTGNKANEGGAIYSYDGSVTAVNVRFENNEATAKGGALYINAYNKAVENVTLTNVTAVGNQAAEGQDICAAARNATYFVKITIDGGSYSSGTGTGVEASVRIANNCTLTLEGKVTATIYRYNSKGTITEGRTYNPDSAVTVS